MELIVSLAVGGLVSIAVWLFLDRSLVRIVLGVLVLGNAINLGVISAGRFGAEAAAFVTDAGAPDLAANPLPQALVLTAIVIGFALFAFSLALLRTVWSEHRSAQADTITAQAEVAAPDLDEDLPPPLPDSARVVR